MADESASQSPDFADGVLKSLSDAVAEARDGDADKLRDNVRSALENLANAVTGDVRDRRIEDPCKTASVDNNATVASACLAKELALKTNTRGEDRATATARSALLSARDTWLAAEDDYEHNVESAATTMRAALAAAVNAYKAKVNPDSRSRNQVLYFTLMSAAAAALQTYQGTAQTEGATLAAAAGALLSAYVAYIMAVEAAHAQKMAADAAANHDFWTTIEGNFDAP